MASLTTHRRPHRGPRQRFQDTSAGMHLAFYLGDLARTPCNFQIKEILEVQPELGVRVEVSRQNSLRS